MDAKKEDVEKFYDFWYNFDSWRSFEMWDKEVTEGSDSRDEKRYQEKKNKAERARAKKEDNTRLREMVDMILASDPRIKRFRQEEKAAREAKKKASGKPGAPAPGKPMTLQQKKAAEAAKLEDLKKQQEEHKAKEAEDKVAREAAKKAKEAAKKNLKKWKKAITTVVSESNYFQAEGTSPSAQVIEKQLAEIDALVEALDPEQVKGLKEEVEKAGKGQAVKEAIKARVASVEDKSKFSEFA
jgi:DnaJ family protein C protein 2